MGEKGMTKCVICGNEYVPIRRNQPTCPDPECKCKWRVIYGKRYAKLNRPIKGVSKQEYKREKAREYRARDRGEVYVPDFQHREPKEEPKCDTSTYAERQRAKTLAMVGKVEI